MLIDKEVKTKWCHSNLKYYTVKGYIYTKMGDEFLVKVSDLKDGSSVKVKVKCDYCGIEKTIPYKRYLENLNNEKHLNNYCCKKCIHKFQVEHTIDEIKDIMSKYNYEVLSDEYMNYKSKIKIKCDKGHIYETTYGCIHQGCKCPECFKLYGNRGEENPNYNPNLTEEQRQANISRHTDLNYRRWFKSVFRRDNYTCQCCGKHGTRINAHHLDGYDWCEEKRLDIDNGVTLCEECHKEFHHLYSYGNNTKEQFEEFILKYVNTEVS